MYNLSIKLNIISKYYIDTILDFFYFKLLDQFIYLKLFLNKIFQMKNNILTLLIIIIFGLNTLFWVNSLPNHNKILNKRAERNGIRRLPFYPDCSEWFGCYEGKCWKNCGGFLKMWCWSRPQGKNISKTPFPCSSETTDLCEECSMKCVGSCFWF